MSFDTPVLDTPQISATARNTSSLRIKPGMNAEQARQAAEDFEAVFISQMLTPMFEGLGKNDYFGGGPGEDIYRSMLIEQYGKSVARTGGLGLADSVQKEILKLQEVARP